MLVLLIKGGTDIRQASDIEKMDRVLRQREEWMTRVKTFDAEIICKG